MHTKWTVLRVSVTDLRGGVELGHLLVDEESVRDPDLLDVVSTHHQLAHLRLGMASLTSRHTDNNNINMLLRKEHMEYIDERAFAQMLSLRRYVIGIIILQYSYKYL